MGMGHISIRLTAVYYPHPANEPKKQTFNGLCKDGQYSNPELLNSTKVV